MPLQLKVLVGWMDGWNKHSVSGTKTRKTAEIQVSVEKKGAVRTVQKERSF